MSAATLELEDKRAALEEQREEIDRQIQADEGRRVASRRKELVAELPTCGLPPDDTGERLAVEIKRLAAELEAARKQWHSWNALRVGQAAGAKVRRDQLVAELIATAPREIDQAAELLSEQMSDAEKVRRTENGPRGRRSNAQSISAFHVTARGAIAKIGELKMTCVNADQAAKEIKSILKSLPKVRAELVEV